MSFDPEAPEFIPLFEGTSYFPAHESQQYFIPMNNVDSSHIESNVVYQNNTMNINNYYYAQDMDSNPTSYVYYNNVNNENISNNNNNFNYLNPIKSIEEQEQEMKQQEENAKLQWEQNYLKYKANKPICKYFLKGHCNKDYDCKFNHVQHKRTEEGNNVKQEENKTIFNCILCKEQIEIKDMIVDSYCNNCHINQCKELEWIKKEINKLKETTCAICLEPIYKNNNHIMNNNVICGIMSDCIHVFCIDCIKSWRNQSQNKNSKTCPLCRKQIRYIIHCNRYIYDDQRKQLFFEQQIKNAKNKSCKYWQQKEYCPFGIRCLYGHFDSKTGLRVSDDIVLQKFRCKRREQRQQQQRNRSPDYEILADIAILWDFLLSVELIIENRNQMSNGVSDTNNDDDNDDESLIDMWGQ